MIRIAILGFGVVGSGVAEVLEKNRATIAAHCNEEIDVKYILDLREFPEHPLGDRVVHDIKVILEDPEVVLVAEMMGGAHPAYDFSRAALEAGKHVVTSNKEVVATFGAELLEIARQNGVRYLFEASVGGGIPIIRPLQNDLASNEIMAVSGILNGTTNFILTKMKNEGASFEGALSDAQKRGYAEANPAADVEGMDAARKIVILAALAFGVLLNPNDIAREGITAITPLHTQVAELLGGAVKLIGHTERIGGKVLCLVAPFFVPDENPVSRVDGVFNGILVDANMLGRAMFYGSGAGKLPTASAVVADIIDIFSSRSVPKGAPVWRKAEDGEVASAKDYVCRRVYLIEGCPKCAAKVQAAMGGEVYTDADALAGKFVAVSAPMSAEAAEKAMAETGKTPLFCLPVLD